MAIQFEKENKVRDEEGKELRFSTIEISNGHLDQLKKITNDFNLRTELHTLAFLLSAVNNNDGSPIRIKGANYTPPQEFEK